MSHPTRDERLGRARRILVEAGAAGAVIRETTPGHGGLRARDVQALVDAGLAEWIEPGARAKATNNPKE